MPDTPPRNLPPKKEVALALLEGDSVFIHLDPRKEGVAVPKSLGKQPQLVLQVGLNLAIRIPDLSIDDDGIGCTLSFNRAPFACRMPWSAIYALVGPDGRGMLWPEDVPPEVAAQMRAGRGGARPPAAKKPRARLASVDRVPPDAPEDAPEDTPSEDASEVEKRTRRATARPALAPVPSPSSLRRDRPDPRAPLGAHQRPSDPGRQPLRSAPSGVTTPSSVGRPVGRPPVGRPPVGRPLVGQPGPTGPAAGPPSGPSGAPGKPRRELPPYLRVVK